MHVKDATPKPALEDIEVGSTQLITAGSQHLQRKLGSKEVQFFAIGGAIGTSLYVQMGSALPKGGKYTERERNPMYPVVSDSWTYRPGGIIPRIRHLGSSDVVC